MRTRFRTRRREERETKAKSDKDTAKPPMFTFSLGSPRGRANPQTGAFRWWRQWGCAALSLQAQMCSWAREGWAEAYLAPRAWDGQKQGRELTLSIQSGYQSGSVARLEKPCPSENLGRRCAQPLTIVGGETQHRLGEGLGSLERPPAEPRQSPPPVQCAGEQRCWGVGVGGQGLGVPALPSSN